jgi:uroporphyrin-III C-methyltransferase/precorrin-2 dehydrogenase/sirohydrochlorin ferrochelatase
VSLHSLPVFVRLSGRPVILVGSGEAAEAKRRLLERAGATVVGEEDHAALAIVADDDAAVERLKARGVLVNAVDRPELCDFTLPAIVERGDVVVAIGTGGVSAGLAAALRQRLERSLPPTLGALAIMLHRARDALRRAYPNSGDRRRAIGQALEEGGPLDPFRIEQVPDTPGDLVQAIAGAEHRPASLETITLHSPDPDQLTLRSARLLALADRVYHDADVPVLILDRIRADADRLIGAPPAVLPPGLSVALRYAP